jgi:hypothetical protein
VSHGQQAKEMILALFASWGDALGAGENKRSYRGWRAKLTAKEDRKMSQVPFNVVITLILGVEMIRTHRNSLYRAYITLCAVCICVSVVLAPLHASDTAAARHIAGMALRCAGEIAILAAVVYTIITRKARRVT